MVIIVDVLVVARGIPFWKNFLREEEDSKNSKEDHWTIEEHPGREVDPQENNKVEIEFPGREVGP